MATYNYHIVTIDTENEFAVIGDGYEGNETLYKVYLSASELEELDYSIMTSDDLYHLVRDNSGNAEIIN